MGNCCSDVTADKYAITGSMRHGASTLINADSQALESHAAAALITGTALYCTWVELRVRCNNLKQAEVLSESDPFCILYELEPGGTQKELGRTEMVANNNSPEFIQAFRVLYNFEKVTKLKLVVLDIDANQNAATVNPSDCDFLGELEFVLSEAVTAKKLGRPLVTRCNHKSTVLISVEEITSAKEHLTFQLAATNLTNVETFGKSDPFLEISRLQAGDASTGTWLPVLRTETQDNNLNPVWSPISVKGTVLNNGDAYRPLRFKVFDYEESGHHRLLGQVDTSAAKLAELAASGTPLPLTNPKQPGKQAGHVSVKSFNVEVRPTFLDYISAGVEISFMVGIDFTGSNGNPTDPASLHFMSPNGAPTPYEEAIKGVGKVLEFYDSDRQYPAFGFGGQKPPQPVSHCFPLSDRPDGVCTGIEGIIQSYRTALTQYGLSGPTLFTPLINMAARQAATPTPHLRYNVLLILTDGAIMDMEDTTNAIINAASLPLSILIVGIGDADFSSMETLDGDKARLSLRGRVAERDIVQFVEFKNYRNKGDALAAELLAELPGQFLAYCRARNIMPPTPPAQAAAPLMPVV